MKRVQSSLYILIVLIAVVIGFAGCAGMQQQDTHKIGVIVYDIADEQVMAFREYLEDYVGSSFQDVEFMYSQSILSEEEELAFIEECISEGAEGIMAFNSFDIEKEVKLCSDNGVYYLRPSATVASEEFAKVEDNPYFIGYFGPGEDMEYQAGADMAKWFADQEYGDEYIILSGGASMGNTMHLKRTAGMLDALEKAYGVSFDKDSEEMAMVKDTETFTAGKLSVTVCGGYVTMDPFYSQAKDAMDNTSHEVILSTIPIGKLSDSLAGSKLGVIDCYNQENSELFSQGKVQYVCGKYSSIIGPAFASMYNAVTGHAENFRDNGKAFKVIQGFWVSDSKEDYQKKYELSQGIALNAYSIDDLLSVISEANESADLEDLRTLADAWDYDSAADRRAQNK